MTKPRNRTVLGIDPGTRYLGIAVLDGDALIYHGVKAIPRKGLAHERLRAGRKIILRLIRDFNPSTLAIEKAFFSNNRNSALLNVFADEIQAVAKRKGLRVVPFAPSTVKKTITGDGRATKRRVAKVVVSRYPELKVFLGQDRKWKERFHGNMFDAVAIAMIGSKNERAVPK